MAEQTREAANIALVQRYFAAVESGAVGDDLAVYLHPDLVQVEYPNSVVPKGATRSRQDVLDCAVRGQAVITNQKFTVSSIFAQGDKVAVECVWTGTLKIAIAAWKMEAGQTMKAFVATTIEIKDGQVYRQANYDCYEPFDAPAAVSPAAAASAASAAGTGGADE